MMVLLVVEAVDAAVAAGVLIVLMVACPLVKLGVSVEVDCVLNKL